MWKDEEVLLLLLFNISEDYPAEKIGYFYANVVV